MSDNPTPDRQTSAAKRGPVIAVIALAVVLVAAAFAYDALSKSAAAESAASARAASTQASSESDETGETGLPQLADYDPTVYSSTGEPLAFSQIADGRPLVVNFWATWCPYCIQEMPDYQEIYDDYADRVSFAFVDCADGQRETAEKARAYLDENGLALPDYYDTKQEAVLAYGATSLPTTVIVDAAGNITEVSPGRIDPARLRASLDSLLEG